MYRNNDLLYLENVFARNSNDIIVVYGDNKSDITDLYLNFIKDKKYFYYDSPNVEFKVQRELFSNEVHNQNIIPAYINFDYDKMFLSYLEESNDTKKVIIINDFVNILSLNPTFIKIMLNSISEVCKNNSVLIILSTTNVKWVENDMINDLKSVIYEMSSVYRVEPFSIEECINIAKNINTYEVFKLYNALGGNICFWSNILKYDSFKNAIIDLLENKNSILFIEGSRILPEDFRNPSVYNTILYGLAKGANKLNDLYELTGIERAKLSVYLKSMISYGLIIKDESIEIGQNQNTIKGSYEINDPFVKFWFNYIFPNYSSLTLTSGDRFYKKYIEPTYNNYIENTFPMYCIEKIKRLNDNGSLDFGIVDIGLYYDKNRIIDFVIIDNSNDIILCKCFCGKSHMQFKVYEDVKASAKQANIDYSKIILFSANGFDQKLTMTSRVDRSLLLIDEDIHWNLSK